MRTLAPQLGGTRRAKRALVGTYIGWFIREEGYAAPLTSNFHLKLHVRIHLQFADRRPRGQDPAPSAAERQDLHSITFMS